MLAGSHHERLDGSDTTGGYQESAWGDQNGFWPPPTRTCRYGRPAHTGQLWTRLTWSPGCGSTSRLADWTPRCAPCRSCGRRGPPPASWPAGLSDREVDVLQLAVRGLTIRQVATRLGIAPKTVDRHLQNSYAKIGVSSRAAAALFVVHHGLLH